jgi:hypothetical protein
MEMPTKSEMLDRTTRHRAYRDDSDIVNLLWRGYLTALNEWELLSDEDYEEVVSQLRDVGAQELEKPLFPDEFFESDAPPSVLLEKFEHIIDKRVKAHGGSEAIILLWQGYLAGLQEWAGFLTPNKYHDLRKKLGDIGDQEIQEIFLGLPGEYDPNSEYDGESGD